MLGLRSEDGDDPGEIPEVFLFFAAGRVFQSPFSIVRMIHHRGTETTEKT